MCRWGSLGREPDCTELTIETPTQMRWSAAQLTVPSPGYLIRGTVVELGEQQSLSSYCVPCRSNRIEMFLFRIFYVLCILLLVVFILWWVRRKPFVSFLVTVAILFASGVFFQLGQPPYFKTQFFESLGHALVIAGILALTVDYYLKNRVLQEVSADVSKYLIGYQLPGEVQDRIKGLLQTTWVRRNCNVRCRLTELADEPGHVRLEVAISDEMENITNEILPYTDTLEFEKHDPERIVELRCDSEDKRARYRLIGDALNDAVKEKKDEHGVMVAQGKRVRIPPVRNTKYKYRFSAKYEVTYPENYSDLVSFKWPTIGVSLEFECPETFRITASPADLEGNNRWEYKRLFLQNDHVRFRWGRLPRGPMEAPAFDLMAGKDAATDAT
jgi:hypothetical protein